MAVSKKDRQIVFDKFGGRCAYCGCELLKGWHVDHADPVLRVTRYLTDENNRRVWCHVKGGYKTEQYLEHPENDVLENYMPACASCNILKSGGTIEHLRTSITNFIKSLNAYTNQYKFAKRYGLVVETDKPVTFYFESIS